MKKLTYSFIFSLLFITSCAQQQAEVNVYSARHYDNDLLVYEQFTEDTGIKVNLIEGGSDELIERIKSEGDNSPADVFIAVDAGRMWRATEAGALKSLESDVVNENVPESLRHPDNLWVSLTRRLRGIVYNPETVDASELTSYEDLADPKWEGRICIRSSNNIYNQSLVASIIESNGAEVAEEWAKGIVKNMARDPQGGDTDQIRAVAAGACDVAVVNHYYYMRLLGSDDAENQEVASKTKFFFPNQEDRGIHVNVSAAGVVANAPNEANAVKLIEYLTSSEAQALLASGNFEFPVNTEIEFAEDLIGLGEFITDDVNVSVYGTLNPEAVRVMDRAGWK